MYKPVQYGNFDMLLGWANYTKGNVEISLMTENATVSASDRLRKFLYDVEGEVRCSAAFLPARRYASAGLCDSDVSVCPSVRLSVCHTPVLCLAERNWCQMRGFWVFSTIFNQYVVISRKRCILHTKLL